MKKVRAGFLRVAVLGAIILALGVTLPAQAQGAVLKIQLRDSHGAPLSGVQCEVLSYGWGLQMGEAYAVIARGVTNSGGWLAFDAAAWPHSGYRFKFTPTPQLQPKDTYFDLNDQYRGYPGEAVGGQAQTIYFFIASDGIAYNDLSDGNGPPTFQRNPVGGLEQPRVSVMPAEQYLATAMAQTRQAQAMGVPTPTIPPKPSPFRGVQTALPLSPEVPGGTNGAGSATPVTSNLAAGPTVSPAVISATRPGGVPVTTSVSQTGMVAPASPTGSDNFLYALLLALIGVTALLLYFKFTRLLPGSATPSQESKARRGTGKVKQSGKTAGRASLAGSENPEANKPREEE